MRIKAFQAVRPRAELAQQVASVPYDTVETDEARRLARDNPWSFLHVGRPEINLPPGTPWNDDRVYAAAADAFARLQREGALVRESGPHCYAYRLTMGDHAQTGVVACGHVGDYENGAIRRHENTRPDKEEDRTRLTLALRAHKGPIFLVHRDDPAVAQAVERTIEAAPLFDFLAEDRVRHTVWRIPGSADDVVQAFGRVPVAYVADGHHRMAAAGRVAARMRQLGSCDDEWNWFLGVFFPSSQVQILPYNRCVRDLNGLTLPAFLAEVGRRFRVTPDAGPTPGGCGRACLYTGGRWYGLTWDAAPGGDVEALDVSVLQDRLLGPVLGIRDPRTDSRIGFVGGIRGAAFLEQQVDSGAAAVAFSLHPVGIEQVMAVSDAGQIMPPKSTWFEPKLRSGLLVHTF